MSQPHMAMAGMGGPVGGGQGPPPMNAGTPTNNFSSEVVGRRLNTAIYEYLLVQEQYDLARHFVKSSLSIETDQIKQSPGQRGNQANGIDNGIDNGSDGDNKMHLNVRKRPHDLPAPSGLQNEEGSFLSDWWFQFWELYYGNRQKGKPNTLAFVGQQRQAQKLRQSMLNGMDPNAQNVRNMMSNNMDLQRVAAIKHAKMTPGSLAQIRNMQNANQANQIQGSQMERQGSQLDVGGPQSASPHSGDAPSPKRQRTDSNMPQMNQGRPGQPGQMQGNQVGFPNSTPPSSDIHNLLLSRGLDINQVSQEQLQKLAAQPLSQQSKSVEVYHAAIQQSMHAAFQKTGSNANKGIPPNNGMGPVGAQSSPMSQPGMDAPAGEFYNNGNVVRLGMQQNGAAAAGQQGAQNNGNHALQDYQMQLMLLEQQNKKRLLMARQEQDSMAHPGGGQGPNGGRGSPTPGMMDPNNPALRGQMMLGPNGQTMIRPPSSNPMHPQMAAHQAEMMRQNGGQMMPNGNWQGGPHPPQGMMPAQQPGQPPNMTPRAGNMPPPPAPAVGNNNSTNPSSPAQPPAPPTPSATNKAKPGAKKDSKANKNASKKGAAAAAANDDNAPPTPTPPAPVTPSGVAPFNQNKNMQMPNGQPNPGQHPQNGQVGAVQTPQDMVAPFGALDGTDQFPNMDFADLSSGDVLETFDFDSFLNNDDQNLGFDANFAFGDGTIETDGVGN